jgi:hypothetical protein
MIVPSNSKRTNIMTDQSTAERLFIDTALRCVTEDSINAAPLMVEIMTAATNGDTDFVLAVANAAIAHVEDLSGCGAEISEEAQIGH